MKLFCVLALPFFLPYTLATVVTTTADEDDRSLGGGNGISLREAVKYSPTGTPITFHPSLSGKTIGLVNGEITFPFSAPLTLTIDASNLPIPVTITGYGLWRIFTIPNAATVELRSLRIIDGNASGDGGGIQNYGICTLVSCTLRGNAANSSGGGIFNGNSGTCNVLSSTLDDNRSRSGIGGGIGNSGNCIVRNSTLSGNIAGNGSGGGVANTGTCNLSASTIVGNFAVNAGGLFNSGTFNLTSSIVAGNTAPAGANIAGFAPGNNNLIGGDPKLAPLANYGGSVETMHPLIDSPAIDAGTTTDPGGTDARGFPRFVDGNANGNVACDIGAVESGPLLTVTSTLDSGSAGSLRSKIISGATTPGTRIGFSSADFPGQAITLSQGELGIPSTASLFIDASNLSGLVTISGGNSSTVFTVPAAATFAMHSLKIVNGRANSNGGGIYNDGTCTVLSSMLSGNTASFCGGGLFNTGTCTVSSSTFSGNSASDGGGLGNDGICNVFSSTFGGNSAQFSGGGIFNNLGTCNLLSSTFRGNSARDSGGIYGSGRLNLEYSIVAGNTARDAVPNITGYTTRTSKNLIGGNPKLTPLGDYGGPTLTMLPLPDSPAINFAVICSRTTDQRGFPVDTVIDLGATEYQGKSDLRRLWPLDWDGDGNLFGLEFALGTDPLVSDPAHPANLVLSADANGDPRLSFGRNPAANAINTWRLTRSATLLPGSFMEIFRYDGMGTSNGSSTSINLNSFHITDTDPPPGKAFYRVEALLP